MSNSTGWGPDVISPTGEILQSPFYGYLINENSAYIYTSLFGLSTIIHLLQAMWYRQWWLLSTVVLCGIGEGAGWGARLWSFYSPLSETPYIIQIIALIVAPTPFIGAMFMTFARMTKWQGTKYSRLSPRFYSRIFFTSDIICLLVQFAGGGMADSNGKLGGLIMLIGIIVQLVFFTIFLVLAAEYLLRYVKDRPFQRRKYAGIPDEERTEWNLKLKRLWVAMAIIAGCLIIRGIYRIIELADGFDGRVIKTQIYFIIFDGAMVLIAMLTLNIFHPGRMLQPTQSPLPLEYITLESGATRFNSSSKV